MIDQRINCLEKDARQCEQGLSKEINAQSRRIDKFDDRVTRMSDTAMVIGLVLYHLDVHHRRDGHGRPRDPADGDVRLGDDGYLKMQIRLREILEAESLGYDKRKRYGLAVRMEDLGIVEWPTRSY